MESFYDLIIFYEDINICTPASTPGILCRFDALRDGTQRLKTCILSLHHIYFIDV